MIRPLESNREVQFKYGFLYHQPKIDDGILPNPYDMSNYLNDVNGIIFDFLIKNLTLIKNF